MFPFRKYPVLTDGCIDLLVEREYQGDPPRGWAPSYDFRISLHGCSERLGGISLRIGDTELLRLYAGHIGYGISPPYRGHRYAARACTLLRSVALDHDMDSLWITCNPDNHPSRRTCEIIGAEYVETVDLPQTSSMYLQGERQKLRFLWRLTSGEGAVA
jgi:predicted acetyltransferase